jgi:hypothetical protein
MFATGAVDVARVGLGCWAFGFVTFGSYLGVFGFFMPKM